jgi:hypothetical protein
MAERSAQPPKSVVRKDEVDRSCETARLCRLWTGAGGWPRIETGQEERQTVKIEENPRNQINLVLFLGSGKEQRRA